MSSDTISTPEKTEALKKGLCEFHKTQSFMQCKNMGEVVLENINTLVSNTHNC
jgi:predicted transcriptional regulator